MMMAVAAASLSKPGCPEKCGNVTIPYPFGIGPECSANANFTLTCRNSTYPPKPFLANIKSEVLRISLGGTLTVNSHVSPLNCSSLPETYLATSLLGTPFTILSDYNTFAVLGCQNAITLNYSDGTTDGCTPNCDANTTNTNCSSNVNCCVATIPSGLQELQYTYQNIRGIVNTNGFCGYAFPVQATWFDDDYTTYKRLWNHPLHPFDPELQYAPLVLQWEYEIGALDLYSNTSCSQDLSNPYANDPSEPYLSDGKFCYCLDGFTGNPYLPGGCLDVDECSQPLHGCLDGICINTPGSYMCHDPRHRVKIKFIISLFLGSALGALILFLVFWVSTKLIRETIKARRRRKFFTRNGGLLLQQQLSTANNNLERPKLFSSKELSQATDHYNENRVLGRGGQGTVYKGMLTDGRIVAIKKARVLSTKESFINELVILSQVNHRNVVKLLGCCLETDVPLLVYEFIPNGTLLQHIQEPSEEFPLSWDTRLRIAREVAGALWYLHSAASAPIYHRDIKSTNILLDDKYRAIVSDFGTSRLVAIDKTHLTTRVLGTFGYLDPEYFRSSQFTEKSDVYSFGVVMVELLTGEKAVSAVRAEEGKNLALHFLHSMEENRLFEILDPRILTEATREEIVAVAQLSERCLHTSGRSRPTMREVLVELEGIHLPTQNLYSINNEDDARDEEYGIDNDDESYEFYSVSESMHFEINTACPPNAECPLLDEP